MCAISVPVDATGGPSTWLRTTKADPRAPISIARPASEPLPTLSSAGYRRDRPSHCLVPLGRPQLTPRSRVRRERPGRQGYRLRRQQLDIVAVPEADDWHQAARLDGLDRAIAQADLRRRLQAAPSSVV